MRTDFFRKRWPYLLAAVLLLVFLLVPQISFLKGYTSLLIFIGIYTMVTLGLCLLMGYTGQVSLGHAAFFGLGAYFSAVLSKSYHVNPWLAMITAACATALFAFIIGYPIFRLRGNYLAMATLGLGIIMYILFRELDQYTGGPDGMPGIPNLAIGGFVFDTSLRKFYLVWAFCFAALLLAQNVVHSRTGRALRAIHASEAAAQSVGINTARYKVKIFVMSAVFASLAGSLLVHHMCYVGPHTYDFLASVTLVVMAVVGGLASIWGAIFGTAAVRLLSDKLLLGLGSLDVIIYGLLLVVIMIFAPQGLFVFIKHSIERWRHKFARSEPKHELMHT